MFLSAGDLTVPREVLQHMYNSLVEQVKRKVARLSFTVKNLTLVFYQLHWQISRFTVWGNDKFKKIINTRRVNFARECPHQSHLRVEVAILNTVFTVKNWAWSCYVTGLKKYTDLAFMRFRIHSEFKNFPSGERIQNVADSYTWFTGYVWTEAVSGKDIVAD